MNWTINTVTDIRTWAQGQGLGAEDAQTLTDAIHNDGDGRRPAWGRDWSDYLRCIDVAASVLAGEVVLVQTDGCPTPWISKP